MDENKLATIRDLKKFAEAFLVIRSKAGMPENFKFNVAQNYIHQRLQDQLVAHKKVRAVILKGRQQGCCFSPEMRILNNKYQWIELKNIKIGEEIFAIDENLNSYRRNKKGWDRKIRKAVVEAKIYLKKEAFEVHLTNGVKLIVTGEHRMLFKQRGGSSADWRQIKDALVGDSIRAFCNPCETKLQNFEDGWFGGLLDGEGTIGSYEKSNPRLSFSQVNGAVLEKAKLYLKNHNIHYYELIDTRQPENSSKFGKKEVHCLRIDRRSDMIKILSMTQPIRLINKDVFIGKSLPNSNDTFDAWPKIESIKSIGEIEVIDLQTSTKTYICEGLVSHNSTLIQARYFHKVITQRGKKAFILTHEGDATKNLFEMTKRYNDNLPSGLCPEADRSSAKELRFQQFDSGYSVGTAGSKGVGRSQTIQLFHGSEVGFWPNAHDHAKGILQAISGEPGTEIILESTANGIGNFFHQTWQAAVSGSNEFQAIFVPWYWQAEYRDFKPGFTPTEEEELLFKYYSKDGLTKEHLAWRRVKIRELSNDVDAGLELFKQEYPFTANEAFLNPIANVFINAKYVMKARKNDIESNSPLIIGVDPAISDRDKTAIIRRRGRCAYGLETFHHHNTMETAGRLKRIILEEQPHKVYIDSIGIGAGIVDRLKENFDCVEGVNVARTANEKDKFKNLRAELWSEMRDWLMQTDMDVQIPDVEALQSALCSVGFKYDSSARLIIESKDDLRARGMLSPDEADALMHTFAGGFYAQDQQTLVTRFPTNHAKDMFT